MVATVLTSWLEEGVTQLDWTGPLANAEAGNSGSSMKWGSKTAQVVGTFGVGGSVAIEGSNDGVTWAALRDSTGTAIALTAATMIRDILENPKFIRPRVTAGDGTTALRVIIVGS